MNTQPQAEFPPRRRAGKPRRGRDATKRKLSTRISPETARELFVYTALTDASYGDVVDAALKAYLRARNVAGMVRRCFPAEPGEDAIVGRIGPHEPSVTFEGSPAAGERP